MKKYYYIFLAMLVILFAGSLFLVSCKSQQPIHEKTVTVENNQRIVDSLRELLVNKAIADKLKIKVPGSNTGNANLDSIINKAVNDILSKMNFSKTSGDNSFEMLYDALKRELVVKANVGETSSSNTKVNVREFKEKTTDKEKEIPVNKPYTQAEKALLGIGFLAVLFGFFKIVMYLRGKFSIVKKVSEIV